jgi:hypothetical protein
MEGIALQTSDSVPQRRPHGRETDTGVVEQIGVVDLERRLGSDRLDVRLSAIYALERIMIDSARDHPAIVDVLAAFVRECLPAAPSGLDLDADGQPEPAPGA